MKTKKTIKELDLEILELIKKRSETYANFLEKKKKKDEPISDSEFESNVWKIWSEFAFDSGINQRTLRTIYNLLNSISYDFLKKEEEKIFYIKSPKVKNVNIHLPGPLDILLTRLALYFSFIHNIDLTLNNVVLTDSIYDFLKASKVAGGTFSWEKETIIREPSKKINFDKKSIYIGDDVLNLYFFLFAAVINPNICKLTGDGPLKMIDLKNIFSVFEQMGARIAPLIPGSFSLPIRIEATGAVNDEIILPKDISDEAIAALLLTLPGYKLPKITVFFNSDIKDSPIIQRVFYIFEKAEINYEQDDNKISIYPSKISFKGIEHIVDPELSSYLMALPIILGGQLQLTGIFSKSFNDSKLFLEILMTKTKEIDISPNEINLKTKKKDQNEVVFDIKKNANALPLALALLFSNDSGIILNIPEKEIDFLENFLKKFLIGFHIEDHNLTIPNTKNISKYQVEFYSPHPRWSIAASLISTQGIEFILENPGDITKLWPPYWSYFKSLPIINYNKLISDKKKEDTNDTKKSRRRILVSGNKKIG